MTGQSHDAVEDKTLHSRVEHLAGTHPDRPAVVAGDGTLTYGRLNERANQVAWRLRQLGVERRTLVGLSVDRCTDMIVGLLAILKAGGTYVPLDPGYPLERLEFVLSDTGAPVVVTQEHLIPRLPAAGATFLALGDTRSLASCPTTDLPASASAGDGAYVIYTSGSTGAPKGVVTTHDNVANLVRQQSYLTIEPQDRIAAMASLSFDASTFEIWGALLNGASCHIYDFTGSNLAELFGRVQSDAISVLALTSPVFRMLEPSHFALASGVRAMLFGGDSVRSDVVDRAGRVFGGDLLHVYGPTETTSFATVTSGPPAAPAPALHPIGHPIRGVTVRVSGPDGRPAAEGELYIGGRGVALGYLNRPELTAERFVPDPADPAARLYRTGDLVRVDPAGELHFLGRLDRQLKVRGHRIEPAEIEAALTRHAGVGDAVVVGRPDGAGDKRLHAYVVRTRPDESTDRELVADLRRYVDGVLPSQQHPATFTVIESIPVTANLKVDEARLPEPSTPERAPDPARPGPSDDMTAALVALWESKLDLSAVGVDDDFFELGGDSMLALQLAAAAEATLGIRIGVRSILKFPTIRQLTEALTGAGGGSGSDPAGGGR